MTDSYVRVEDPDDMDLNTRTFFEGSLSDFLSDAELDERETAFVRRLAIGETLTLGGGASPEYTVLRIPAP